MTFFGLKKLLMTHPEYQPLFLTIVYVPVADLPQNENLKKLSVSVLGKLDSLLATATVPDALSEQLIALGEDHKKIGVKRSDFDVSLIFSSIGELFFQL